MNFKELSQRLDLEESEYRELIDLFIETSASDLKTFHKAIKENNDEQAAWSVHSIKGAASNLGLMEVYEAARKIELDLTNSQVQDSLELLHLLKDRIDIIAESMKKEEAVV
jgi:HPt (histidine-containing phosphotransfer) domain-containing protein